MLELEQKVNGAADGLGVNVDRVGAWNVAEVKDMVVVGCWNGAKEAC